MIALIFGFLQFVGGSLNVGGLSLLLGYVINECLGYLIDDVGELLGIFGSSCESLYCRKFVGRCRIRYKYAVNILHLIHTESIVKPMAIVEEIIGGQDGEKEDDKEDDCHILV